MDTKYKTRLCNHYKEYGKCDYNDKCRFAHGEQELICLFDEECINNSCKRKHQKRDKNKEIIEKSIKNNNNDDKINILEETEFPHINDISVNNKDSDISNVLFSDILKNKDDLKLNNEKNINKQIEDLDIKLSCLDDNNWCDSIEIENIEREKNELKELNKNNTNGDYKEEFHLPKITFRIEENGDNNDDEILRLVDKMMDDFIIFKEHIIPFVNNNIKYDYIKYSFINDLNKIKLEIESFKNNYKDICFKSKKEKMES